MYHCDECKLQFKHPFCLRTHVRCCMFGSFTLCACFYFSHVLESFSCFIFCFGNKRNASLLRFKCKKDKKNLKSLTNLERLNNSENNSKTKNDTNHSDHVIREKRKLNENDEEEDFISKCRSNINKKDDNNRDDENNINIGNNMDRGNNGEGNDVVRNDNNNSKYDEDDDGEDDDEGDDDDDDVIENLKSKTSERRKYIEQTPPLENISKHSPSFLYPFFSNWYGSKKMHAEKQTFMHTDKDTSIPADKHTSQQGKNIQQNNNNYLVNNNYNYYNNKLPYNVVHTRVRAQNQAHMHTDRQAENKTDIETYRNRQTGGLLALNLTENWCAKCNVSFRMTSDLVYHMR